MWQKLAANPYIGLWGLIVSIVGIAISLYLYVASQSYRAPAFIVDPARIQLLSKSNLEQAPIKVIKLDGTEITSDLTIIQFYFWNNGNESIRPVNILQNIELSFDDPTVEIIDFKVLQVSREVTNIKLVRSEQSITNTLSLSFDILEGQDGFAGQVVFEGNSQSNLIARGVVEGVTKVIDNTIVRNDRSWVRFYKLLKLVIGRFALSFLLVQALVSGLWWYSARRVPVKFRDEKYYQVRNSFYVGIPMLFLVFLFLITLLLFVGSENEVQQYISDEVPKSILRQ